MAGQKRQRKRNLQNPNKPPKDWQKIHPKFKMVMYHAGKWYEMGCYECGANRSVRSVWGKKGLLEHIMREHGRYCDPNDTSKNESDHVTMQRCKQPREFSDEDIRKMRKGEQPDQRIDMSKRSAKKPYKETKFEPSI